MLSRERTTKALLLQKFSWGERMNKITLIFALLSMRAFAASLTFILNQGVSPDYGDKVKTVQFMLSSLSRSSKLNPTPKPQGNQVTVDTEGILDDKIVDQLLRRNPYNCSQRQRHPLRVDWLASQFDTDFYYLALGVPNTFSDFARRVGIPEDLSGPRCLRTPLIRQGRSHQSRIAAGAVRVIIQCESDKLPGKVTLTHDFDEAQSVDLRQAYPTNPFTEVIFPLPNGLHGYALFGPSGGRIERQESAPSNVVRNNFRELSAWKARHFPSGDPRFGKRSEIRNASDCMTCHRSGLIGPQRGVTLGSLELGKQYTADERPITDLVRERSKHYLAALHRVEAYFSDPKSSDDPAPVVPDLVTLYGQDLGREQLAKELGVPLEALNSNIVRKTIGLDTQVKIPRKQFERVYCEAKKMLSKTLTGPQAPPFRTTPSAH